MKDHSSEVNTIRANTYFTETNKNLISRHPTQTISQVVNMAIDNYFTFNLTLYIIVHRISKSFHIGYYEDHEPHDLHWHYIYSTGSGTVGDCIRKEGFGRHKLEIIGKFGSLKHLIGTYRHYRKHLSRYGEAYESHRDDDNLEVLLKTYMKSIGKYGKEKINKV